MEADDSESLDDILKGVSALTETLYAQSKSCEEGCYTLLQKARSEVTWDEDMELYPKAPTQKWLVTLGWMKPSISYMEFLTLLFDLYRSENRLDYPTRTIRLRKKDAKVFGLIGETPLGIFIFLASLPTAFY
jgi:hypothetical protein